MAKRGLFKRINVIDKGDMTYAVVYALRGYRKGQPANTIGLYFSKKDAEETKEVYCSAEIYDVLYIIEKIVWF